MATCKVFVVSDSPAVCDSIRELLESVGLEGETFSCLRAFLDAAGPARGGILVLDTPSNNLSDQGQLLALADCCPRMTVIVIAERGDVPTAVRAVKAGAMDVLQKPYRDRQLLDTIKKALEVNGGSLTPQPPSPPTRTYVV